MTSLSSIIEKKVVLKRFSTKHVYYVPDSCIPLEILTCSPVTVELIGIVCPVLPLGISSIPFLFHNTVVMYLLHTHIQYRMYTVNLSPKHTSAVRSVRVIISTELAKAIK